MSDSSFKILSLDGGGIKGVFSASVLADFEAALGQPVADYFDLIVGTSTGGIIALGLGMGLSARDILAFYEDEGPLIFGRPRKLIDRFMRPKYDTVALQKSLEHVFGKRLLGESSTRLVIPSMNLETGEVHVFKTAHHERFERDYKESVVDVAMATAAAPTYFPAHYLTAGTPLVDGGLWANNPMGPAAVEALGVLGWPAGSVQLLSIGCTEEAPTISDKPKSGLGYAGWARHLLQAFMNAQSSASIGTAMLLLGHANVHRISKTVSAGRYTLDGVSGTTSLRGLGASVARVEYPKVKETFFMNKAAPFLPLRRVDR